MDNLAQVETYGLPINRDACFSTHKNKFHKGVMKRQLKILKPFAPMLKQFLKPGEEILIAVRACSPMSLFEQMTTSWVIYYLKRCVLIFTNKRVLHFPARPNFSPKKSIAQVLLGDLEEFKLRGSFLGRVLTLKYKSGKTEKFPYVQGKEFKKLKTISASLPRDGQPSEVKERHHLCPRCQARLEKDRFSCGNCHLKFKDTKEAWKFSVLYPGGGYFYTRHPILGVGDALVEAALLIALIAGLVDIFTGAEDQEEWLTLIVIALFLFFEKAISVYHARHYVNEYIPLEENFVPITSP